MTDRDGLRDRLHELEERLNPPPRSPDDVPWDVPSREEREAAPPGFGITENGDPGLDIAIIEAAYSRDEVLDILPEEEAERVKDLEETVEREGAYDDDNKLTKPAEDLMSRYFECAEYELEELGL